MDCGLLGFDDRGPKTDYAISIPTTKYPIPQYQTVHSPNPQLVTNQLLQLFNPLLVSSIPYQASLNPQLSAPNEPHLSLTL